MNIHQNVLTTDISATNSWYNTIADGDTIVTDGYYEAGDGGGATFTVRTRDAGEQADGLFVLNIYGASDLVAKLNLPNDTVIVDQLGYLGTVPDPVLDLENADTTNYSTWYSTVFTNNAPCDDGTAQDVLEAALENENVREIQFLAGKWYPFTGEVCIETPDKCINGNGALIFVDRFGMNDDCLFSLESGANNKKCEHWKVLAFFLAIDKTDVYNNK